MLTGTELFNQLSRMTEQERANVMIGQYWTPGEVDTCICFHESCFTDEEREIIKNMPLKDKAELLHDVCLEYFTRDEIEEPIEINDNIELKLHSYCESHHKTKYNVTMSFLIHATIEVDAIDADQATKMALEALSKGKITFKDLEKDDQWPETAVVDEVYNTETEQSEKNIFMRGEENHPKQKKDFENKEA